MFESAAAALEVEERKKEEVERLVASTGTNKIHKIPFLEVCPILCCSHRNDPFVTASSRAPYIETYRLFTIIFGVA